MTNDDDLVTLVSMFPNIDQEAIANVLESEGGRLEEAVELLLGMPAEPPVNSQRVLPAAEQTASGSASQGPAQPPPPLPKSTSLSDDLSAQTGADVDRLLEMLPDLDRNVAEAQLANCGK